MEKKILVIGGCRSGKSNHALELAQQFSCENRVFIATCVPHDDEMRQRIARHRKNRDNSWKTLEVPVALPEAVTENSRNSDFILIDCLTLWISNLLMETEDMNKIDGYILKLVQSLKLAECPVIAVSNEVGEGIVPENRIARLFRDIAGFANQKVAACADEVFWLVAGIPVKIKG